MTNEEAIAIIRNEYKCVDRDCDIERSCGKCDLMIPSKEPILEAYKIAIKALEQEPKTGHCKDCKYFEYDSVARVDGVPLIVAHEICSRWGDGCKTKEDGYCFLFEPQESEEQA